MGRFASTVEFYARYREPYPTKFFKKVAEQIALRGDESLLDVGCGPGLLAIGFAPFVGQCTGLDPETGMIAAAKAAAAEAGVALSLIHGRIDYRSNHAIPVCGRCGNYRSNRRFAASLSLSVPARLPFRH